MLQQSRNLLYLIHGLGFRRDTNTPLQTLGLQLVSISMHKLIHMPPLSSPLRTHTLIPRPLRSQLTSLHQLIHMPALRSLLRTLTIPGQLRSLLRTLTIPGQLRNLLRTLTLLLSQLSILLRTLTLLLSQLSILLSSTLTLIHSQLHSLSILGQFNLCSTSLLRRLTRLL